MFNLLIKDLQKLKNPQKAKIYRRFFKTGKGEYGEGDVFIGLTVPQQRELAKKYVNLSFPDVKKLLSNKIHEYRLTGFFILVYKYEKGNQKEKKKIVDYYLSNVQHANNWDLIDCVADKILGNYLLDKDKKILYKFANSDSLWERRIAIISTFEFIKNNEFDDTLRISEILLNDKHDLIHKAVGWMLREVGKRNQSVEEKFLKKHYKKMPRTMLRYAIERFDENKRKKYLGK
ncbi:DNA alkylation repair protein [Candidatus Woesearchaeota archaeon]|jgi:3-methyladenine DNA glycosylase AlkD|nr:DNA alkylation repair protein [Candidatus Woesearchaeota archaeon]|tara:strand:- start:428 stop:1123 length:696 start_codon:yes stop_codon:yes gene_type:complete